MSTELNNLKKLTPILSHYLKTVVGNTKVFFGEKKDNEIMYVYDDDDLVGVVKAVMEKGDRYPIHIHEKSIEVIVVYQGHLVLHLEHEQVNLPEGAIFRIDKAQPHEAEALEHTKVLGITIPRDESYKWEK